MDFIIDFQLYTLNEPKDIRYIDNNGWNDHVFRKNTDPDDFSDQVYQRVTANIVVLISEEFIP